MSVSTLSSKGQVVIPRDIRERLGLHAGDQLEFTTHGDHIDVKKQGDTLQAFFNAVPKKISWGQGELEHMLKERHA